MRAVAQRVTRARVRVGGEVVAELEAGLLALVGVAREDVEADARALAEKLVHLRVFADESGSMNRSLLETGGALGVVSQFTLLGDTRKGRRPSFDGAARPEHAQPLIELVTSHARSLGVTVVTGVFRAEMEVELTNAGPVTLILDTARRFLGISVAMMSLPVRTAASVALVVALTVSTSVHAEEKQERNLAAHYGLGVGAAICSLVYGPVKIVYATLGAITSGFAWVLTGGRTDVAREIITASVRGDYVVTPENLTFNEPLVFTGRRERDRCAAGGRFHRMAVSRPRACGVSRSG